jgi:hypothetical protein
LYHISLCFVSNDLLHDVALVWKIQQELFDFIKGRYPFIQEMEYFTDSCAAQNKNYKSFLNHCYYKKDYELPAKQSYFATSDGKNSYGGVGGNVKRRITRYNLQNPLKNQITTTVI